MEEENVVLGENAETKETVNSENGFVFFQQDKNAAKNNVDSSARDLTDFLDFITKDVPELSDMEVESGIERILENTHPIKERNETQKADRKKKYTLKVLFIAAILSILSVSCLCVVGTNNDISIDNGFVTFAKDTVRIVFFGEEEERYISAETLLLDLENHGFKEILFPEEILTNSDKYKLSVPRYSNIGVEQVGFDIYCDETKYTCHLTKEELAQQEVNFVDLNNAKTITVNGIDIYIFAFDGSTSAKLYHNGLCYNISMVGTAYEDLLKIVESIK